MSPRKGKWGIPSLEHCIGLVLIGILIAVMAHYALKAFEQTEQILVATTVQNIRSGLRLERARRLLTGESKLTLLGSNPVNLLKLPPVGYLGELDEAPDAPAPGSWFFLRPQKTLHYKPQQSAHLIIRDGDNNLLGWKIVELPAGSSAKEIQLASVISYQWFGNDASPVINIGKEQVP